MSVRELVSSFPGPETSTQSRLRRIIEGSEEKLKPKIGRLENNFQKELKAQLISQVNLQEPCILYMGRVYRYPPDVAFYIFFQQI
jgi:hypothetical protein